MPKSISVACVGEAMIELSYSDDKPRIGFAGDALNTAIYLRRNFAEQSSVSFLTAVGNDPFSQQMLTYIDQQGVLTSNVETVDDRLPGLYAIETDKNGERSFYYWRENSAARLMFSNGFSELDTFDVIYFSGITLAIMQQDVRIDFLEWIKTAKKTIAFDSNYRPSIWENTEAARRSIEAAWRLTDIGLPSVDDEIELFGDSNEEALIERLNNWGVTVGALKRGEKGPRSLCPNLAAETRFKSAINVVDTTAAGDSFNGAFLASYLQDANMIHAMQSGHNCAIEVLAQPGAIIPYSCR